MGQIGYETSGSFVFVFRPVVEIFRVALCLEKVVEARLFEEFRLVQN